MSVEPTNMVDIYAQRELLPDAMRIHLERLVELVGIEALGLTHLEMPKDLTREQWIEVGKTLGAFADATALEIARRGGSL